MAQPRTIGGSGGKVSGGAPSYFFKKAIWNTLWMRARTGNYNRYATAPIRSTTSYTP
jgi:hypothetical protein